MSDDQSLRRHRLSALANGILIGMGVFFVLIGGLVGLVSIAAGVGIEFWQRSRIPKQH